MKILPGFILLICVRWRQVDGSTNYGRVHVRPGRHVCLSESVESRPIPVTESYKKAMYTPRKRNCSLLSSCPQYDVTYVTATKTAYHVQKVTSYKQDCCPGWTTRQRRGKGCMQPVCSSGCGELGRCVQPGLCECPAGFQGDNCDIDIDECRTTEHGCHQFCTNTAGSFLCACQEGFSLAVDGKTCTFCFTCSKEYINMQEELKLIRMKVQDSQLTIEQIEENFNKSFTEIEHRLVAIEESFESINEISVPTAKSNVSTNSTDIPADNTSTASTSRSKHTVVSSLETSSTLSPKKAAKQSTASTPSIAFTSSSKDNSYSLTLYMYDRFASLSEQIGQLEEAIGMCKLFSCYSWADPEGRQGVRIRTSTP